MTKGVFLILRQDNLALHQVYKDATKTLLYPRTPCDHSDDGNMMNYFASEAPASKENKVEGEK